MASVVASGVAGLVFLIALTVAIEDIGAVSGSASPVSAIIRSRLGPVMERVLLTGLVFALFGAGMVVMTAVRTRLLRIAPRKTLALIDVRRPENLVLGAALTTAAFFCVALVGALAKASGRYASTGTLLVFQNLLCLVFITPVAVRGG